MGKCNLYSKITRGAPLGESEIRLLGEIIKEELKFLVRNNILPTPKNYEKWFLVFCHALEKGGLPSDSELVELYHQLHGGESISEVQLDVELAIELLSRLTEEFQKLVKEQREYAVRKEREISSMEGRISEGELASLIVELLMHIRDIKAMNERFLRKIEEQQHLIKELKERVRIAEREANTDYLTGIFNRRSFERALREAFEEYKKRRASFSLVLIDLDNFKQINDNFGHSIGDIVLRQVAHLLRKNLRARDILARWGGDEFAVLIPGVDKEQASKIAERLKNLVENMNLILEGQRVQLSFSYGVVQMEDRFSSIEELLEEADRELYKQKRGS